MDRMFNSIDIAWTGWMYQHSVPSDFVSFMRGGNVDAEYNVPGAKTGAVLYNTFSESYHYCHGLTAHAFSWDTY